MSYVKVKEDENEEPIELPLDDDGTLSIANLTSAFPESSGLKFRTESNTLRSVRFADGKFHIHDNDTIYHTIKQVKASSSVSSHGQSSEVQLRKNTIGSSSFEDIRYSEYFVDKTLLLKELFSSSEKYFIITAPPRFGKSINVDMVYRFVKPSDSVERLDSVRVLNSVFKGTAITSCMETIRHMQKYPVIRLSLYGMPENYEAAVDIIRAKVYGAYSDHTYLEDSKNLNETEKKIYRDCGDLQEASGNSDLFLQYSLKNLAKLIVKHYGTDTKVILLVDEFEAVITNSMFDLSSEELTKIIKLRDSVLGELLKHEKENYVRLAILTGVADVICTVASPLNNVARIPVMLDNRFTKFYGITQNEFEKIASDCTPEFRKELTENFNGYYDGENKLYNTWSLIQSVNAKKIIYAWSQTGPISHFKKPLKDFRFFSVFENLLSWKNVKCGSHLQFRLGADDLVNLSKWSKNEAHLLNFDIILIYLFQCGYLTKEVTASNALKIPNVEIYNQFKQLLIDYFQGDCLVEGDLVDQCSLSFPIFRKFEEDSFNNQLRSFCKNFETLCSSFNCKVVINHQFLHSLIFMIIIKQNLLYNVVGLECRVEETNTSKRCDIVLQHGNFLGVIEIKWKETVLAGLNQIERNKYLDIVNNENVIVDPDSIDYFVKLVISLSEEKHVTILFEVLDRNNTLLKSETIRCAGN